jgi:outer membrane lipoprotein-sorting protein
MLIVSFLTLSAFMAKAQSATDIINKYIIKIGGSAKWNALQTLVSAGNTSIMGQEFPFTISSKAPNLTRLDVTAMGQTLVQAYDGKTAWTINPFQGSGKAEAMSPEMGKAFASQNQLRPVLLNLESLGIKAALSGKETINSVSCDKIELTHPEGDKDYYFFDPTSLLVLVRKTPTTGQAAGKLTETYFSDYKDEQGILLPHTTETKVDGQTFSSIVLTSVKINAPVDSKIFDFPTDK